MLLLLWITLMANNNGFTQAIITDSIPKYKMIAPTMFMFGFELLGPAYTLISEQRSGWELEAALDVYRYFIVYDYGAEFFDFQKDTYNYSSEGTYWRFGADINMIPRDEYGSLLYFGLRYSESILTEKMTGKVFDKQWGTTYFTSLNGNVNARWIEIVAGMRAKIWKELYMGYTLRLKTSLRLSGDQELESYRIPGYGLASESSFWGVNYYISWRFKFREKYTVPQKE